MVGIDRAIIARLKKEGHTFEILVDPDLALLYRNGEKKEISPVLAINTIFKDAGKGEHASETVLKEVFNTSDPSVISDIIIKKGEIQLTTEQKRKMVVEKKKQIVAYIVRNTINPQTKTPHTPVRIEQALDEGRFSADISKSVEEQIEDAIKVIRPVLPIRFEKRKIAVKIPSKYAGSAYQMMRNLGEIKKEEWSSNGDFLCMIEFPAGIQDEVYSRINGATHGECQIKVIE